MLRSEARNEIREILGSGMEDKDHFVKRDLVTFRPVNLGFNERNAEIVFRLEGIDGYVHLTGSYLHMAGRLLKTKNNVQSYEKLDNVTGCADFPLYAFSKISV